MVDYQGMAVVLGSLAPLSPDDFLSTTDVIELCPDVPSEVVTQTLEDLRQRNWVERSSSGGHWRLIEPGRWFASKDAGELLAVDIAEDLRKIRQSGHPPIISPEKLPDERRADVNLFQLALENLERAGAVKVMALAGMVISITALPPLALFGKRHQTGSSMPPKREPVTSSSAHAVDRKKVFVIYGRNENLRDSMFTLLRASGLEPREWGALVLDTGQGTPHNLDVVTKGLASAVAVVALWSGDDLAQLRQELHHSGEKPDPPSPQPRPNVILETGLALATKRDSVIIVKIGSIRNASDLDGLNYVAIQDQNDKKDTKGRKDLIDRLKAIRADVEIEGKADWMNAGDFQDQSVAPSQGSSAPPLPPKGPTADVRVIMHETIVYGFFGVSTGLKKIAIQNTSPNQIWRIRIKVTYHSNEGVLGSRIFTLGTQADRSPILPKGGTTTFLWVANRKKLLSRSDLRFLDRGITSVSASATRATVEIEGYDVVRE